jgi:hypothetical protein
MSPKLGQQSLLELVVVDDDQRRYPTLFQSLSDRLGRRSLVIDKDDPGVLIQIQRGSVANEINPQKFNQGHVLQMADPPAVDNVHDAVELGADDLVGKGRRDAVGVGKVLQNNEVSLTPMSVQNPSHIEASGLFHSLLVYRLIPAATICHSVYHLLRGIHSDLAP